MLSTQWRKRLMYAGMSALVAWHTFAMLMAPASDNGPLVKTLMIPVRPYLTLFYIDNGWQFFAPNINRGTQLWYTVEDKDGHQTTFRPRGDLNWLFPTYIWFNSWYQAVLDYPDDYADAAGAYFCKQQAALHPVSVTIQKVEQDNFEPSDWLAGKHPMDAEFLDISDVRHMQCPF